MRVGAIILLLALALGPGLLPSARAQDELILPGYRYIGDYRVTKRIKIREGSPFPVATKKVMLRAFTDGITVRLYSEGDEEGYTSFTIYRNDGISVSRGLTARDIVPGLQANTLIGDVMRQLTLTEDRLVLTKFPALSDLVEVTYANRQISLTGN